MVYETTVLWLFTLWEIGKAVWRIFFVLVIDSFAFNENYYAILLIALYLFDSVALFVFLLVLKTAQNNGVFLAS